jgi:hypothetical protein
VRCVQPSQPSQPSVVCAAPGHRRGRAPPAAGASLVDWESGQHRRSTDTSLGKVTVPPSAAIISPSLATPNRACTSTAVQQMGPRTGRLGPQPS